MKLSNGDLGGGHCDTQLNGLRLLEYSSDTLGCAEERKLKKSKRRMCEERRARFEGLRFIRIILESSRRGLRVSEPT